MGNQQAKKDISPEEYALQLEKVAELREKEKYDQLMKQREQDRAIGNQFEKVNRQYLGQ